MNRDLRRDFWSTFQLVTHNFVRKFPGSNCSLGKLLRPHKFHDFRSGAPVSIFAVSMIIIDLLFSYFKTEQCCINSKVFNCINYNDIHKIN